MSRVYFVGKLSQKNIIQLLIETEIFIEIDTSQLIPVQSLRTGKKCFFSSYSPKGIWTVWKKKFVTFRGFNLLHVPGLDAFDWFWSGMVYSSFNLSFGSCMWLSVWCGVCLWCVVAGVVLKISKPDYKLKGIYYGMRKLLFRPFKKRILTLVVINHVCFSSDIFTTLCRILSVSWNIPPIQQSIFWLWQYGLKTTISWVRFNVALHKSFWTHFFA